MKDGYGEGWGWLLILVAAVFSGVLVASFGTKHETPQFLSDQ